MLFQMHLAGAAKPAFAVVAAHGLTDLDSPAWVRPYVTMALVPLPTEMVTALFCAASIAHFSDDSTVRLSVAVHAGVLVTGLLVGVQAAFMTMLAYLTLLHVPGHYARCVRRGRRRAASCAFVVGAVAALASMSLPECDLCFNDELQKLVIAHIIVEKKK